MSLQNDLQRAASGGDCTAIDVADWLMEQHNAASAASETKAAEVIWSLMKPGHRRRHRTKEKWAKG